MHELQWDEDFSDSRIISRLESTKELRPIDRQWFHSVWLLTKLIPFSSKSKIFPWELEMPICRASPCLKLVTKEPFVGLISKLNWVLSPVLNGMLTLEIQVRVLKIPFWDTIIYLKGGIRNSEKASSDWHSGQFSGKERQ